MRRECLYGLQIPARPQLHAARTVFSKSGQDDRRNFRMVFLYPFNKLPAVHFRHDQIGDDKMERGIVGGCLQNETLGLITLAGGHQLKRLPLEVSLQGTEEIRFIVNYENFLNRFDEAFSFLSYKPGGERNRYYEKGEQDRCQPKMPGDSTSRGCFGCVYLYGDKKGEDPRKDLPVTPGRL